jgi:hypothetical protein
MAKVELDAPPPHPVKWEVTWYKTPDGTTAALPWPGVVVEAKTWFEARTMARARLAHLDAEAVEVVQVKKP